MMVKDNVVGLTAPQSRLSVNLNDQSAHLLREYMARSGVEVTEAVRRFVGVAGFVLRAIDSGSDVLVRQSNGQVERVTFDLSPAGGHDDHVHVRPGEMGGE